MSPTRVCLRVCVWVGVGVSVVCMCVGVGAVCVCVYSIGVPMAITDFIAVYTWRARAPSIGLLEYQKVLRRGRKKYTETAFLKLTWEKHKDILWKSNGRESKRERGQDFLRVYRMAVHSYQRRVFKDCFRRHSDLRRHENRFLGPTSTLETSFHAGVGCHADRNNL